MIHACARCWIHEDCLVDLELSIACGPNPLDTQVLDGDWAEDANFGGGYSYGGDGDGYGYGGEGGGDGWGDGWGDGYGYGGEGGGDGGYGWGDGYYGGEGGGGGGGVVDGGQW